MITNEKEAHYTFIANLFRFDAIFGISMFRFDAIFGISMFRFDAICVY